MVHKLTHLLYSILFFMGILLKLFFSLLCMIRWHIYCRIYFLQKPHCQLTCSLFSMVHIDTITWHHSFYGNHIDSYFPVYCLWESYCQLLFSQLFIVKNLTHLLYSILFDGNQIAAIFQSALYDTHIDTILQNTLPIEPVLSVNLQYTLCGTYWHNHLTE